ncbi:bola-like protein-domain-containing protein [Lipomyces chichibuensis]|uniref:bola-like protein-domain-containing protein n=1 Tax=Lipomyces chichibuensis TaxID=1546026 RepID=UPI0033438BD0
MFSPARLLIRSLPYRPPSGLLATQRQSSSPKLFLSSVFQHNMSTEASTAPEIVPDFGDSKTPYEDKIRWALTQNLKPTYLKIHNDSHKHAHHAPMRDSVSKETHFRLEIVSEAFEGKRLPMRHRLIYQMFSNEMNVEGGIHAMQLLTLTPKEWEVRQSKK